MPRFSFSLQALAGFTAFIAAACAALIYASPWVASGAFLLSVVLLTIAILGAIEANSSARAFWRGFAICGWLYLILTAVPPDRIGGPLLTTSLLQMAAHTRPGATTTELRTYMTSSLRFKAVPYQVENSSFINNFIRVGHACLTVLVAFAGGLIAQFFRFNADRKP